MEKANWSKKDLDLYENAEVERSDEFYEFIEDFQIGERKVFESSIPEILKEKEILEAYSILDSTNWSREDLDLYYNVEVRRDWFYQFKKDFARGNKKNAIEFAKKRLKSMRPIEEIVVDSGLSRKEIESLRCE